VWKVVKVVRRLIERGERWRAVDLMAHTLLPVRQTGVLIVRFNDISVYYENITQKMHMLKSEKLARVFEELGIGDGPPAMHRS